MATTPLLRLRYLEAPPRLEDQADAPLGIGGPRNVRPIALSADKEVDGRISCHPRRVHPTQTATRDHILNYSRRLDRQVPLIDAIERIEPAVCYRDRKAGIPLLRDNV